MLRSITVAAMLMASSGASAANFSISGDFGTSVFAYGRGTVGSSFSAYTGHVTCNPNLDCYPNGSPGNVVKNTGATDFFDAGNGTVRIPAGTVHFHPLSGIGDTDAIIRFIAPVAGTYAISGSIWRNDITSSGNGTIVSVYAGASQLFQTFRAANSYGTTTPFNGLTVNLLAGGTVDFGVNNNGGDYGFDSTGIEAFIAGPGGVPEPAQWAMMLGGFGLLGSTMRRRRAGVCATVTA